MICLVNERNTTVLPCRYGPSAASLGCFYLLLSTSCTMCLTDICSVPCSHPSLPTARGMATMQEALCKRLSAVLFVA